MRVRSKRKRKEKNKSERDLEIASDRYIRDNKKRHF